MRRTPGATGSSRPYSNEHSRRNGMSTAMTRRLHEIVHPPQGFGLRDLDHDETPRNSLPHGEMQGENCMATARAADNTFVIRDLRMVLGRSSNGRQGNFDNSLTSISYLPHQHLIYQIIIA